MDNIIYLTKEDFDLKQGKTGKLLGHNIPDISVVLFHSSSCLHCEDFVPIYRKLPTKFNFCRFIMVNLSHGDNMKIVQLSQQTIEPIRSVPLMMVYYQGKPIMIYQGPRNVTDIVQFLEDVYGRFQQKNTFMGNAFRNGANTQASDLMIYKNKQMLPYNIIVGDDKKNCYPNANGQCSIGNNSSCYMSAQEIKTQNDVAKLNAKPTTYNSHKYHR